MKTIDQLKTDLSGYIGCIQPYSHKGFGGTVYYTDGFKGLLEQAQAYWLLTDFISLEVVQIWRPLDKLEDNQLYVFDISVDDDRKCTLSLLDGDLEPIKKWHVPYTTFPIGVYQFYIRNYNGEPGKMFCFLKSEY